MACVEPWEHVCVTCGKTFLSAGYTAKYCPECKLENKRERNRVYSRTEKGKAAEARKHKTYRENHPDRVKEAKKKWDAANVEYRREYDRKKYEENREHICERQRLYRRKRKGDTRAAHEHAKLIGKLKHCPRMHVHALSLPCGERNECWMGKPCELLPKDAKKPVKRGFGVDHWSF